MKEYKSKNISKKKYHRPSFIRFIRIVPQSTVIFIVNVYRKFISPLKKPSCIYTPTCSQYALEALTKYGFLKGTYLSIRRILRCHPFAKGGFDPVP